MANATLLQNVTIVGAGTQGSMLAFRSAIYGRKVWVYDLCESALQTAQIQLLSNWGRGLPAVVNSFFHLGVALFAL